MRSLVLAAILAAGSAHADLVATNGVDFLRLSPLPCEEPEIISKLEPNELEGLRAASAFVRGQIYRGCWLLYEKTVIVGYVDGDVSFLPLKAFREDGA